MKSLRHYLPHLEADQKKTVFQQVSLPSLEPDLLILDPSWT